MSLLKYRNIPQALIIYILKGYAVQKSAPVIIFVRNAFVLYGPHLKYCSQQRQQGSFVTISYPGFNHCQHTTDIVNGS